MAILKVPYCCEKCGHEGKQETSLTVNKHEKKERAYDVSFMFNVGKFVGIDDELEAKFKKAYPGVNYERELLKMSMWLQVNPHKAKKDYVSFIMRWLGKVDKTGVSIPMEKIKSNKPLPKYICNSCGASVELEKVCSCLSVKASSAVIQSLNVMGGKKCGS